MAGRAKRTTDHETIKRWIEERGGSPATVKSTKEDSEPGMLRVDYPGYSGEESLEPISWDAFFQAFEKNQLAFLYQDAKNGEVSRFSKFVSRSEAEEPAEPERGEAKRGAEGQARAEEPGHGEAQRMGLGAANGERRERRAPSIPVPPSGLKARDVMTPDPMCCTPGTPLKKVAKMMVDLDCGAIPVVDSFDNLLPVGIITDRDIVARAVAAGHDPRELSTIDCMSSPVITVSPDDDIENVIYMLEQAQVRRVVVVDESGKLIGVVAQADLVLSTPDLGLELVESVSLPRSEETGMSPEGGPGAAP